MTSSEAFLAWIDGSHIQVLFNERWSNVHRFYLGATGLVVFFDDGVKDLKGPAIHREYRVPNAAPAEPKPTVEDSEAWGLLRDLFNAFRGECELTATQRYHIMHTYDALKKRGMV